VLHSGSSIPMRPGSARRPRGPGQARRDGQVARGPLRDQASGAAELLRGPDRLPGRLGHGQARAERLGAGDLSGPRVDRVRDGVQDTGPLRCGQARPRPRFVCKYSRADRMVDVRSQADRDPRVLPAGSRVSRAECLPAGATRPLPADEVIDDLRNHDASSSVPVPQRSPGPRAERTPRPRTVLYVGRALATSSPAGAGAAWRPAAAAWAAWTPWSGRPGWRRWCRG
jgi:hypothetical protein